MLMLMLVISGIELVTQGGAPIEEATVVSAERIGSWHKCGRRTWGRTEVIDLRVAESRPGFPDEWTSVLACSSWDVGDVVPVARTGPDPEDVQVGAWSVGKALSLPFMVGAGSFVFFVLLLYFIEWAETKPWFSK